MQSTRQAALVSAGGADLSGQEVKLFRRRRRGAPLTRYQHQWLNALWPDQAKQLEEIADNLDRSDREVRRARRNGIAVIDAGRLLPAISAAPKRPLARRRGAGRPRATRSSAESGDSGDSDGPGEPAPATLRVRRPSGAAATFHATACTIRAGVITAIGSWADLRGTRTYSWPARRVLEVKWLEVVA